MVPLCRRCQLPTVLIGLQVFAICNSFFVTKLFICELAYVSAEHVLFLTRRFETAKNGLLLNGYLTTQRRTNGNRNLNNKTTMTKDLSVSLSLFVATAVLYTWGLQQKKKEKQQLPPCQVVFVLGGPGAGKGTQCSLLQERKGWAHLSAGDLLRAERKRGGPVADLINNKIKAGQIVPAHITVGLLESAMRETKTTTRFLIDGFPRSEGNVTAWQEQMSHHKVEFVLNLECPEEVLVGRLLERGQTSGRSDDQIDVIRKRFQTFQKECKPIVEMYDQQNKVRTILSDKPVEDVYQEIALLFQDL